MAAVVSTADLELLWKMECLLDIRRAHRALAETKSGGVKTLKQFKKELGLD